MNGTPTNSSGGTFGGDLFLATLLILSTSACSHLGGGPSPNANNAEPTRVQAQPYLSQPPSDPQAVYNVTFEDPDTEAQQLQSRLWPTPPPPPPPLPPTPFLNPPPVNCIGTEGLPPIMTAASSSCRPASHIFCGNARKFRNDGPGPAGGTVNKWEYNPGFLFMRPFWSESKTIRYDPATQAVQCYSNPNAPDIPATERTELRGWFRGGGFSGSDEEEYGFNILLDNGWSTPVPGVNPVNTLDKINQAVTPYNIIDEGWKTSADGYNRVYGGAYQALIHVEVDAWGSVRGCEASGLGSGCDYYFRHKPEGWKYCYYNVNSPPNGLPPSNLPQCYPFPLTANPDGTPNVTGPFPLDLGNAPPAFQVGDYIRVVGTLWEDGPHINGCQWYTIFNRQHNVQCDKVNEAKQCWNQGSTSGRGWKEIHPVDLMEKIPAPAYPHSVYAYAACTTGDPAELQDYLYAYKSPPFKNSRIQIDGLVDGSFTNWRSFVGGPPTFGPADNIYGTVHFSVDSKMWAYRGLYKGVFDAYWGCAPDCQGRCSGDDGCGGSCGSGSSAGQQCVNSQCVCTAQCGPSSKCGDDNGCGGHCPGSCDSGRFCVDGACQDCPAGQSQCPCLGSCASPAACRQCNTGCPAGTIPCDCTDGCTTPAACAKCDKL